MTTTTTVAFIGLGHMGGPMAANLVRAGYRVLGHDLVESCLAAAEESGVERAKSATEAAAAADVVITMLPAGRHVLSLYGQEGLLEAARPGTLFVDCSTIDVADSRAAHAAAAATGHRSLDAPVSGGVVGAEAGTLTFMAGGEETAFAAAEPLLSVMGKKAVHCGGAGAGQAAKICNNMILGVSMIAVSEAFVLAESLGLSDQALYDVASAASGQCWALTVNCPVPARSRPARPTATTAPASPPPDGEGPRAGRQRPARGRHRRRTGAQGSRVVRPVRGRAGADQDFSGIVRAIRAASSQTTATQEGTTA